MAQQDEMQCSFRVKPPWPLLHSPLAHALELDRIKGLPELEASHVTPKLSPRPSVCLLRRTREKGSFGSRTTVLYKVKGALTQEPGLLDPNDERMGPGFAHTVLLCSGQPHTEPVPAKPGAGHGQGPLG